MGRKFRHLSFLFYFCFTDPTVDATTHPCIFFSYSLFLLHPFLLMALLQSLASSSSSSSSYGFTYDVFLSFRGSDTRYGFTGYLHKALSDKGIRTFINDVELEGGEKITQSLVKAIEDSRIFIPVFSINYASSSFCLDELVHIIHRFEGKGGMVLPVFYGVDPSHVRHQIGSYGEAIAKHEERFQNNKEKYNHNMERLQKWKMALNKAANLSGCHFSPGSGYEYEFIGKIVDVVSNKTSRTPLHVVDYRIGLESRVLQVISLLDGSDDGVRMVGIHGIGGIGKSTLAREIYNFIASQYEELCFLDDVREKSVQHGLVYLQETLLYETTREKDIKLGSVNKGISIIKQMLHRKKVLLILDDVDELKQLQVMVGEPHWLGPGSRVIITTRDKHLLASHGIERIYEVEELNEDEALELLRWKAFKNNKVDSSYGNILKRAVTYASGLPLALEVVGSNLCGKHRREWESTLARYKRIPNKEIQKILKVSFDTLEKDVQSVFLDIACCFKGYRLAEVEDILCAHHDQCMKYHIRMLVEKSLIKISLYDIVTLHDLIEDMGKEIVRLESTNEPGKRSRLWFHKDIVQILEENSGTSQIEIIYLNFPPLFEEEVEWEGNELKKMINLKILIIKNGCFSKGPEYLPYSLRVLEWRRYPSPDLPSDFWRKNLSICKLGESRFRSCELHRSFKWFVNIRELNLDDSQCLIQILDVSGLPNLEIFSFRNCENLIKIHESIGFLNKLKILNAESCSKLRSFPPMKLTFLQELRLSYCKRLESFPEILGEMDNIKDICLLGTSIEELPFSFQTLTGLRKLVISGNGMLRLPSFIFMMSNLSHISAKGCVIVLPTQNNKKLDSFVSSNVHDLMLQKCNLSNEFLPILLTWIPNVILLNLSGNNFTIVPECIKECRFLWSLDLDDCKYLQEIRGIPPDLKHLSAFGCESLTFWCRSILLNQELHEAGGTQFRLPGGSGRIPEWFEHQSWGTSISLWFRNNLPSIALFFVTESMHYKCPDSEFFPLKINLFINGYKCTLDSRYVSRCLKIRPNHTYLFDMQLQNWVLDWKRNSTPKEYREFTSKLDEALLKNEWIHAEVMFEDEDQEEEMAPFVTEIGIHVFEQYNSMGDIQFTNHSL